MLNLILLYNQTEDHKKGESDQELSQNTPGENSDESQPYGRVHGDVVMTDCTAVSYPELSSDIIRGHLLANCNVIEAWVDFIPLWKEWNIAAAIAAIGQSDRVVTSLDFRVILVTLSQSNTVNERQASGDEYSRQYNSNSIPHTNPNRNYDSIVAAIRKDLEGCDL
ncbi:hypothetical protein HYALB_00006403 [Hymenoscyphus albidus]|uniref:Uncharacterized protein n=1 Tax=Hymenoscyphus albidus TaxID=595503 RepID=A0A9N9Q4B6_9HELO|nr:hypothetical protein HYALB_00006403 [Hymenoscyphus albidus]